MLFLLFCWIAVQGISTIIVYNSMEILIVLEESVIHDTTIMEINF